MSAIRVLMCDMPPMLQSMVREMLQAETDIEILPPMGKDASMPGGIDVLLVSAKNFADSQTPIGRIASLGASGIVAIDDSVDHATIVHFHCSGQDLTADSGHNVSTAIRDAFRFGRRH